MALIFLRVPIVCTRQILITVFRLQVSVSITWCICFFVYLSVWKQAWLSVS